MIAGLVGPCIHSKHVEMINSLVLNTLVENCERFVMVHVRRPVARFILITMKVLCSTCRVDGEGMWPDQSNPARNNLIQGFTKDAQGLLT